MAIDYNALVKIKEEEQSSLDTRYDNDKDLLYLRKYTMMDADGKNAVPDIVNVTLNIPGRFAHDVIARLGSAKEQTIVETEDKNLDTTYIEDFQKAGFGAANAMLGLQGKFELNPWWDFHSSIRGSAAARCLFRMGKGKEGKKVLISDIATWDRKYVTYAIGGEGLDWGAYKTKRTKDAIEAESWAIEMGFTIAAKEAEVLDVWSTEHNEVWVEGRKIFEQPHEFGFCPIVIRTVVLGSMLADEDSLEHQGESVFFLIRDAIPELNRLVSIMQTLNLKTVKPPVGWASKDGKQISPEYEDAMSMGAITQQESGGGVTPINFGDAQRSAQLAFAIMNEAIAEATIASSGLAVIESPPASGVRAMVAGENIDQLLSPRLGLKAAMNQGLADMFTAQVIQIGGSVELGTPGHKRMFQTSKLDGQYETFYKYTIKSVSVDAGRASLAAAYGDDLSWRTKAESIYQLEDVDGEERRRHLQEAEALSPAIKMSRIIDDLIEEDRSFEAELLTEEMGVNLQQMLAGDVGQQPKPEKIDEPTQVLSLHEGQVGRPQPTKEEE